MSNRKTLIKHMLGSQVSAAVLTFASFGVLILLTRSTTVATFGQYSVVIATVTTFMRFAGLNVYFHYRNSYPTASYSDALKILRSYLPAVLILGVAISMVFILVSVQSGFAPVSGGVDYALWAVLGMLSLLNLELVRFYQSIGRNMFGNWLGTAAKVACLALLGLCVMGVGRPLDLRTILAVLIGAQLAPLMLQLISDRPFLDILKTHGGSFEARAISAGVLMIPSALFYDALTLFDRLAISSKLSYETAGHYGLASQGIMIGYTILGGSLITMFYPRLVRTRDAGQTKETRAMIRLVFLAGGGACVLGAIAILVLSGLIPMIFGADYAESVDIVRMMCFVPLALFVLSALAHIAYLFDDLRLSVAAFAIGTVECGILNYWLVAKAGVTGAVAALYVTLLTVMVMHFLILSRRSSRARLELLP